ncbi:MAG: dual specificity protein phosphatase family protein [Planctomycetota bacterium]
MRSGRAWILGGLALVLLVAACATCQPWASTPQARLRPATWARPLDLPGCPNLHEVAPGLYRGAQPSAAGFASLAGLGIRTVVDLRTLHSDRDELAEAGVSLNVIPIPMVPWHPEDEDVVRFLRIATDPERLPVFVHCQYGADRTGTLCAAYRIVVQGWSKEEALREMTQGGFGYHALWENLLTYVRNLDVESIRSRLGPQAGRAR